jgi:EAL domain-containing protein (putative c-di-GMP-specific phosphodiesterase class I)
MSFVPDIEEDSMRKIYAAVIYITVALKLRVVAEGVGKYGQKK